MMNRFSLALALVLILSWSAHLDAQSLRGSRASLIRQNRQAQLHDYTYLRTPADVRRFVELGYLVPIRANADYDLSGVSFPYARPEVEVFLQRLGRQYRRACGEKLVVTSLLSPHNRQPPNAAPPSVHPTRIATGPRPTSKPTRRKWRECGL